LLGVGLKQFNESANQSVGRFPRRISLGSDPLSTENVANKRGEILGPNAVDEFASRDFAVGFDQKFDRCSRRLLPFKSPLRVIS